MGKRWDFGWVPWIRTDEAPKHVLCYFCGETRAIISLGDKPEDRGRIQVYCDNADCDARIIDVIPMRTFQEDGRRADVQALNAIDRPWTKDELAQEKAAGFLIRDVSSLADADEGCVARRQRGEGVEISIYKAE